MVLVSDKPSNDLGILQTKLSDRERYETRRVGLEAMPLDEDIEGRHGEGQARLKIGPAPMHDLFEMADERQHREHRLDEHPVLPLAALTQFEVGGIALGGMEGGITQDNHPPIKLLNQPLKGVIRGASIMGSATLVFGYALKAGQLTYDCHYSTMHGMPVTGGRGFRGLKPLWYNGVPP